MRSDHPRRAVPVARLLTQLAPAALVTTVGLLLLANLAREPEPAQKDVAAVEAINAEAVFTAFPQQPAAVEPKADVAKPDAASVPRTAARTVARPKPALAAKPPALPPRLAMIGEPAAPLAAQPDAAPAPAPAEPARENFVMSKLRGATAAVRQIPQAVSDWFSFDAPPRPPAPIPVRDFAARASM